MQAFKVKIEKWISLEYLVIAVISVFQLINPLGFIYVSQHNIHPITTNMSRGITTIATHLPIFYSCRLSWNVPKRKDFTIMMIRCSISVMHQLIYAAMYYVLPFPILNTLIATGPLFVFLIDYLVNSVAINRQQMIGISTGIIGVVITINSDIILSLFDSTHEEITDFKNYKVSNLVLKALLSLFLVLCNFAWAYSVVLQKQIAHINGITISLYVGIGYILSSGAIYAIGIVPEIETDIFVGCCFFSGLVLTLAQLVVIAGLNLSKNSGLLSITMFLGVLTSNFISYFRYGEKINIPCILGMLLIVFGLARTIAHKSK